MQQQVGDRHGGGLPFVSLLCGGGDGGGLGETANSLAPAEQAIDGRQPLQAWHHAASRPAFRSPAASPAALPGSLQQATGHAAHLHVSWLLVELMRLWERTHCAEYMVTFLRDSGRAQRGSRRDS
jgi:hypothetical protein